MKARICVFLLLDKLVVNGLPQDREHETLHAVSHNLGLQPSVRPKHLPRERFMQGENEVSIQALHGRIPQLVLLTFQTDLQARLS